jgi:hypothetical protein
MGRRDGPHDIVVVVVVGAMTSRPGNRVLELDGTARRRDGSREQRRGVPGRRREDPNGCDSAAGDGARRQGSAAG